MSKIKDRMIEVEELCLEAIEAGAANTVDVHVYVADRMPVSLEEVQFVIVPVMYSPMVDLH